MFMTRMDIRRQQADEFHREQLRGGRAPDQQPRYDVFLELLREANHTGTGQKILDIGCHFGDFLIYYLKANGYKNLTGFDFSEVVVPVVERADIRVVLGDIEALDMEETFAGERFDCIFMGDVLEHIFEPTRVLRVVRDLLSPTGRLIMSVPNAGWVPNGLLLTFVPRLRGLSPAFGSWTHCNQFTLYDLRGKLSDCGFYVEACRGVRYHFARPFVRHGTKQWIANTALKIWLEFVNLGAERYPSIFSPHLILRARKMV